MLKSILLALDGSPYSDTAEALGVAWAKRFGGSLIGLAVLDEPSITRGEPVPIGASAFKAERDQVRLTDARAKLRACLDRFRATALEAGVAAEIVDAVGDPADHVLREAHRSDVIVLGRETHFRFETQAEPDQTLARILRASPRPVVVAPRAVTEGEGVVVAYGGGREVARTLQTFQLLGLDAGEIVHLVSVERKGWEAASLASLAGRFLARHGVSCVVHPVISDALPADALLDRVESLKPRLLVMGAHGHSPVRDLFRTSVAREVLDRCPVPVFIGA